MAELGKAKEAAAPDKSEAEETREIFIEELTKDEKKPEDEKKAEEKAPEQEVPEKAPETKPEPKAEEKKAEAPKITDEDKALLTAYDFTEADANPKLLTALRKAEKDKHGLRTERDRWGEQNKELSGKLKAFSRAEATNIDLVKEKIKGRLSKIPKDKLSEHARNLLDDPAYLEAQAAMMVAQMTEEEPEAKDEPATKTAAADPEKQREEALQLFDEVKKTVPDITDIYSKREFYDWLKAQDRSVQALYFEYKPESHVNLAGRYKAFLKAEQAAAAIAAEGKTGDDAFAGHGSTGQARRAPDKELTPEEERARILSMSDEEFKKLDRQVLAGGR